MSKGSGASGTRRRVRLDVIDRERLRDAIVEAIAAAEGDLRLAAAVLRMPLAALQEIVDDDPSLTERTSTPEAKSSKK